MASMFGGISVDDAAPAQAGSRFGGIPVDDGEGASQPQPPSAIDEAKRQLGLLYRFGVEGATALPTAIGNIPAATANAVRWAGDRLAGVAPSSAPVPYINPFGEGLDALGAPQPQTKNERLEGDLVRALSGTGMGIKAGQEAVQGGSRFIGPGLASALASSPVTQAAAATTGGLASGFTREGGGGPTAQLAAGLAGSLLPFAGPGAIRGILRGGPESAANMQANLDAFQGAGTTPSLGQATEGRLPRSIESFLTKTPGSAGVMADRAARQGEQIGSRVDDLASLLAPSASAEEAGRAIAGGVKNSFLPQARGIQSDLYDRLDQFIPPETTVKAANTISKLQELTQPIEGAENLSNSPLLRNSVLTDALSAIKKDTGGTPPAASSIVNEQGIPYTVSGTPASDTLPYEALKELRSRIGAKLENVDLTPDIPRTQLKQLYGALSDDMKGAADQAGPDAVKAWSRANNYTSAFHDRMDRLQGLIDKGDPEKIFQAATSGTGEGATTLRALMRSLPDDNKPVVSAAVLRRLGRATPGNQNDVGNLFSANTFLTNWNRMSPEARDALFGGYGSDFSGSMNKIAKVASNLREGSKVFQNPSGTATGEQLLKTGGALGSAILAAFTGHPGIMATIGAGMGTANLAARAFTNPTFVTWLAKNSNLPASALPTAITTLDTLARQHNDPEPKAISGAIQQAVPAAAPSPQPLPTINPNGPQSSAATLVQRIAQAESAGNPAAKNPNSSASGPLQFTDDTWTRMVAKYGKQTGITLQMKNDPRAQAAMGDLLAKDNAKVMASKLGRPPTDGELYAAHFFGAPDVLKLINAAQNTPGKSAIMLYPRKLVNDNRSVFFDGARPRSVSEVYSLLSNKVQS